jgi:uncharacterized membrane protein YdjX (TVP38/TMEM64 family)
MNRRKILLIAVILAAAGLFFGLGLQRYLTFESLKANRDGLRLFYENHRLVAALSFMALYVLVTALSLPGAAILSLSAGAIFGTVVGTACAVVAATTGATLAFLATRYLFRDAVQRRFGERFEKLDRELEREGLSYLLFLRLVPLFPFFLINLAAGLTRIPLRTFFIGTLLGIVPGGFVYVNAGAGLASIDRLGDVASPRVLGSFALLGLFALVPALWKKLRRGDSR